MSNYYLQLNGEQVGPYSETEIQRMYSIGQISDEDSVWEENAPAWVTVGTLLGVTPTPSTNEPTPVPAAEAERPRGFWKKMFG